MVQGNGKVLAASLTPLQQDSSIDQARFAEHVRWLLETGCDAVVLFGTTGEGNSFSGRERKLALEAVIDAGVPPQTLIVGTGCCALPDTVDLTDHAVKLGVDSVLVLPPFYYKTATDQGIYDTFAKLIETIGSNELRIVLYHFPKMAIVCFSPDLIARLVTDFPDQIVGIKDSTGDRDHTQMLNKRFPSIDVYAGSEIFLLDYLRSGGAGCISATVNVTAELAARVRDMQETSEAEPLQARLSAIRGVFEGYPLTGALKGLLAKAHSQTDWANVREPLSCLDGSRVDELSEALSELGFDLSLTS